MTRFEDTLQSELRRKAADLVPDGTQPPELVLSASTRDGMRAPGWLSRWRAPLLVAAAVVAVGVTTVAVIGRSGGDPGPAHPAAPGQTVPSTSGAVSETGDDDGSPDEPDTSKKHDQDMMTVDPFNCAGEQTTAAIGYAGDGNGPMFGITGSTFCVRLPAPDDSEAVPGDSDDGPTIGGNGLAGTGPLRALVRVTDDHGWSVAAGATSPAVTKVRAIRGDDDADGNDHIPDITLPLYSLGNVQVFEAPADLTRAVVLYEGDEEVARSLMPVSQASSTVDEAERYDLRHDLISLQRTTWQSWEQTGPARLRIFFSGGPSACYGADVTVEETDTAVRVGLETGWKPEVDGCDDPLVPAFVDITLDAPLGDRDVEPLP